LRKSRYPAGEVRLAKNDIRFLTGSDWNRIEQDSTVAAICDSDVFGRGGGLLLNRNP